MLGSSPPLLPPLWPSWMPCGRGRWGPSWRRRNGSWQLPGNKRRRLPGNKKSWPGWRKSSSGGRGGEEAAMAGAWGAGAGGGRACESGCEWEREWCLGLPLALLPASVSDIDRPSGLARVCTGCSAACALHAVRDISVHHIWCNHVKSRSLHLSLVPFHLQSISRPVTQVTPSSACPSCGPWPSSVPCGWPAPWGWTASWP